jgi:heme exporter protein CcmD
MQNHGFYLILAYGAGAILIALEIFLLAQRCRRASRLMQYEQI